MLLHELTAGIPWVLLFYVFTWGGFGVTVLQWIVPHSVWTSLMVRSSDDTDHGSDVSAASTSAPPPKSDAQAGDRKQEVVGTIKTYMRGWIDQVIVRARNKGRYGYRAEVVDGQVDSEAVQWNEALPQSEIMAGALADAVAAYLVVKVRTSRALSSTEFLMPEGKVMDGCTD